MEGAGERGGDCVVGTPGLHFNVLIWAMEKKMQICQDVDPLVLVPTRRWPPHITDVK